MNLYWKRLFGKIATTSKVEANFEHRRANYNRYLLISKSKELAEYNELFKKVKSPEFKENKRTLISRKYKDTQFYRDMTKFHKLERNSDLHLYYRVLESKELKDYLAFKEKPEFVQLGQPKAVKASAELSRLKDFETSKEYKIYTRFHNSYIVKEYTELKEKVTEPEFVKSNEFWSNKNRWETTKEYQMECRYMELYKNDDIQFYLHQKKGAYDQMEKYDMAFEDTFAGNTLQASAWAFGFAYTNPALVKVHSLTNENQANMGGKNISVVNGQLHIATKEKKVDSLAWDAERGFVQKSYDYTSDVINCAPKATIKCGVVSAKMRVSGSHRVEHALWLQGADKSKQINVAHFVDGEIELGNYWHSKYEKKYTSTRIKGLKTNEFYIYTLMWTEKELVWYINDFEVFRSSTEVPMCDMAPVFNSFIPAGKDGGEADFEIDFIRILKIK